MRYRGIVLGLVPFLLIGAGAWAKVPIRPAVELDQLLGPIALYPDPLLAQILPAATAPDDLGLAVKYLEDGGDLGQVDTQPWNDNARALARYPEVLRMMNRSREWTEALGAAFLDQPKDVMDSIQRLRAAALSSGALQTMNEQRVAAEKGIVCIYPADPSAIQLPQYDPNAVFGPQASAGDKERITFGSVLLVGYWLNYELDWRKRRVYSYDCQEYPYGRRNPWYFGGQRGSEVFPNIPKQRNQEWKPDKKKSRPYANLDEPPPTIQNFLAPAQAIQENEPSKPMTESRPLEAPKDIAPPPPALTPVDPAMETVEESPAAKPVQVKPGAQEPVARAAEAPKTAPAKAAPAKAVKVKPTEEKPASARAGKAKAAEAKSVPTKAIKTKPAEAKPAPAKGTKAKPEDVKSTPAKGAKAKPGEVKSAPAKGAKAKPAPAKGAKIKPEDLKPAQAKDTKAKPAEAKTVPAKGAKAKPDEEKPVPAKGAKRLPAEDEPSSKKKP